MNFKVIYQLALATSLIASTSVFAQEATQETAQETAEEAASNPDHTFPIAEDLEDVGVERARNAFLSERGWALGTHDNNPSGSYLGWGVATLAVGPSDVNYGEARIAAIDAAIAEALGNFALSRGMAVALDRAREILRDPNALNELRDAEPQAFLTALENRLKELSAARLDQALESLGVPRGKHQDLEFVQKVTLARDAVQTQIARGAREYFQGIRLLRTFEDQGAVGALVVWSPGLQEMANRILSGNIQAVGDGQSSDAVDQLNNELSDEKLLFMHGTRILKDKDGNPVIVAFGQASPAVERSDGRQVINMAVTAARRQADMRADGALAEFLDTFVEVDDQSMAGVAVETVGELHSDGRERQSTGAQFYNEMRSSIRQRSQINISGVVQARTWSANHPDTGHLHVGSVRMWSPTTEAALTGRASVEAQPDPAEEEAADEGPAVKARSSTTFGDEDW